MVIIMAAIIAILQLSSSILFFRIMNGNATRRGVMLCSKCSKMIGCRSKICKHCKHSVTESTTRPASNKLIKQAVKLCLPAELDVQIYSVRKCKTGPELRCFVQFDSTNEPSTASKSNKYACDYPLCVTAKELGDKTSAYMCEHARFCCNSTNILLARVPTLDFEKLAAMDCSTDMKDSVQKLHGNCQSKGVPLVQYVSSRTLAVVEEINVDPSDSLGMGILTFAHVRFENVKGQGCFQRQVFCSGRSCMAWNFLSNDSNATAGKTCSCVHYAAALWAIASDASLQKDLGEYLDAFVSQVKPGDSS